jgi:hypothetical protein
MCSIGFHKATEIAARNQELLTRESGISVVSYYPTQVEIEDSMLLRDRWSSHNETTSSKST